MKKFYLGMDIGTESVGMACTDENYNLLRAKGKDLWCVRLFDEASDASERRIKRTARRRLQRRKQRIEFLQGIFAPYMDDKNFFLRLNNSPFYEEDKDSKLKTRFSLFSDDNYTDADFYHDYPTIFHLRKYLIDGNNADLRHYYLALHHIIKYRGHFLFEGEDISSVRDIKKLFFKYNSLIEELNFDENLKLSIDLADAFKNLSLQKKGLNDKKKEACALFNASTIQLKEIISLLIGASASPKKLFGDEYEERYKEFKSLCFKGLTDENFEALSESFEEEHFELLRSLREIYNFTLFEKILDGSSTISDSMVTIYNNHKNDLRLLKHFVKNNYSQEVYYTIFRSRKESANYVNYIGYNMTKGKKQPVDKKCNTQDFYKFLKKTLQTNDVNDKETLELIINKIDNEAFLQKIINADNGLFPHQINGMELDLIVQNLCTNYPEFLEKDADGYTPAEKIKKIFLFKIPYYVGPLNPSGKNGWMVRKDGKTEKITPWNFDQIVDKTKSNEAFILRMTNKCSYLHNQDVLPKGSMYYQAFDVLNQINKLTINDEPINTDLKKEFFNQVFLKNKKVTLKHLKDYLLLSGRCSVAEIKEIKFGGFDTQIGINATMSSYVAFKSKFGDLVDTNPEIFENVIFWHTLNTDKNLVIDAIMQNYGDILKIKENIKWLKGLTSFKEFGKLSKKLLCDLYGGVDPVTGEVYTILNRLYNTNDNFNQILFNKAYTFTNAIEDENSGNLKEEITYEDVTELYVSPMVRRGIWQALTMTDEYVKAVGKAPDKIFIEVTRHDEEKGDKGRTKSRKNNILELYQGLNSDCSNLTDLLKQLNHEDMTDSRLRQERLYLYFLQLGKCAYTGEQIDLGQLSTDLYDVDHILPQSITKDDSLDNKVLVLRNKNAEKTDTYPLPYGFTNQQPFWKLLNTKGLMSDKKYARLTRTKPLTADDFREFVNRQLVVTNQIVKAVAELLKRKYNDLDTKIVYSKAKNVDDFKQKFNIVKCRETNDLHHARDAYLNIVVGNIYDTKFTSAHDYYYRKPDDSWREYNLKYLYNKPIENAWNGIEDIARIKSIVSKTSMIVTRYAYTYNGAFYNETVYKKDDGATAPIKNCYPYTKTNKYGGFKSLSTAYFAIVQSKDKKGNLIKTIEAIPVLVDYQLQQNKDAINQYLLNLGLKEPKILVPKLKIKSLLSINGYKVWLAGITGKQIIVHNAQQWFTDKDTDLYVKQLVKLIENEKQGKLSEDEKQKTEIPLISNRNESTLFATKEKNINLYRTILTTLNKKAYQGLSAVKSFTLKLQEKQSIFEQLTTFEQCKVLLQVIRFLKCNAECADLSLLNDGSSCGKLLIAKNITDSNFAIINQSPCGLTKRIQKI
ncbi:MAG: type II CRISPR RNA-guided endonuclease Cas9 [Clostridia bacterium]|nr:type II CRISPR RNA-guided endonuclease Cas9 [Clostridia bacterium]